MKVNRLEENYLYILVGNDQINIDEGISTWDHKVIFQSKSLYDRVYIGFKLK